MRDRSAFPVPDPSETFGMNLLEWFAGHALAGGLNQRCWDELGGSWTFTPQEIAARAFSIGQAMIKEGEKRRA